ncbi:MAG: hypothetical protein HOP09_04835 [Hyphomicrobium sp.]|nr:hypothetical protein [Hyphomicrobium sp.]
MTARTLEKSDNVIAFPGGDPREGSGEASAAIVDLLEGYLARARSGVLAGIVIVTASDRYPHEFAMKIGNADPLALLASLEVAKHRLINVAEAETEGD